jgi:hypothetical protein
VADAEREHDLGEAPEQRQESHPEQDQDAYQQRPLPSAAAGRCNPSGVADGTRTVLLKTTTSTSLLLVLDAGRDQSTRPEYLVTRTPF